MLLSMFSTVPGVQGREGKGARAGRPSFMITAILGPTAGPCSLSVNGTFRSGPAGRSVIFTARPPSVGV